MRQGQQNRRGRGGRHNNNAGNQHRKGQNPLTRSFESNGPDVKIRGTPAHVAEKYISLARDALSSGDRVLAENYLQHAEHYNRIILTYREQHIGQHQDAPGRFRVAGMADLEGGDDVGDEDGEEGMDAQQPPRGMEPQPSTGGQPRQDERGERHMRHERQDRFDRPSRHERPHRHGDQQRYEGRQDNRSDNRQDNRSEGRGEARERADNRFEGQRGEGQRGEGQRGEGQRGEGQRGEGRPRYRDRDREQPRMDQGRGEQPSVAAEPPPASGEATQRAEPQRRRERFAEPQDEQPAFLRRSVRRSRRESAEDGNGVPEAVNEGGDGKPAA